ncbi:short-chain dehydrogenase (plasmid) [Mycolicibacterium arabiense]|uniref:Short-chain dehydrogenase n=1 Tax=Mycolicibacterium arabiense TaxID=1286181 RepID=A0A7I7RQF2_9MYCO|nr:SDR family NAD(P)-dependent oxidoreductase [Mycolicibacterium arabiense]MCV7376946.1 SDR family oxidoreductase [Mycolicibacterium arabiense]BBY46757.1 short-chain dehydrogenase [Mycolicibacterium arabiense]
MESTTTGSTGQLHGLVAFVAGATSGIGRHTAELFAAEGAHVVVGGRRQQEGAQVVAAINAQRARASAVYEPLDVTDEGSVATAVGHAVSRFGRLDILVNAAGGSGPADGPVTTASLDQVWQNINVDLYGCFLMCRAAIPHIARSGGGSVVNIASLAGLGATTGRDGYTVAKAGVLALTTSTAREFAPQRIRVNAIAPAAVRTDRIDELMKQSAEVRQTIAKQTLGVIEPSEIAHVAMFLASERARSVTGQVLTVNGGLFD